MPDNTNVNNNSSVVVVGRTAPVPPGQQKAEKSLPVVIASDQSSVKVKNEVINEGSHANASNNASLAPAGATSVVDISNMNFVTVLYEDTATASFDSLSIQVSVDGTNYFSPLDLFPSLNTAGTKRIAIQNNFAVHGLKHMKLVNESGSTTYTGVTATIVGAP